MQTCSNNNVLQQFNVNSPSSGYISSNINSSLCITVAESVTYPNCTMAPFNTYPYCNQNLPTEMRVNDLVQRMNFMEKINALESGNSGIPQWGVPKFRYR